MLSFQFHAAVVGTDSMASMVEIASRSEARVRRIRNCLRDVPPRLRGGGTSGVVGANGIDGFEISRGKGASITMAIAAQDVKRSVYSLNMLAAIVANIASITLSRERSVESGRLYFVITAHAGLPVVQSLSLVGGVAACNRLSLRRTSCSRRGDRCKEKKMMN